jgi:hypothetical protein
VDGGGGLALAPVIFGVAIGASALTFLAFWAYEQRSDQSRRIPAGVALAIGAAAYCAFVYGALVAPRILTMPERVVSAPEWRGPAVRVAVVALPELGPRGLTGRNMARLIERINRASPDLVLVVGDLTHPQLASADMEERFQASLSIASLARLEAPLGVVAVLGPADAAYNRDGVARDLEDAGVAVLWNRAVVVDRVGAPFVLAGWAPGQAAEPEMAGQGGPIDAPILAVTAGDAEQLPPHTAVLTIVANRSCARRMTCANGRRGDRRVLETAGLHGGGLSPPEVVLITLRAADPS